MKVLEIISENVIPFKHTKSTRPSKFANHRFKIGQTVRHIESHWVGKITGLLTLGDVVDGDCDDGDCEQPWYIIKWLGYSIDHRTKNTVYLDDDEGQEAEDSLELLKI